MKKVNNNKFLFKSVFFIVSFCLATYLVLWIEKLKPSDLGTYKNMFIKEIVIKKSEFYNLRKPVAKLTEKEMGFAKTAWIYFVKNCHEKTGLVNGRDHVPNFTMADLSSYLMATISAYELKIIDSVDFDNRIVRVLASLQKIPLYDHKLPNKKYSTSDMKMLDEENNNSATGIGWSALDIGRFYSVVQKILFDYPQYVPMLKTVVNRWKMEDMIVKGNLYSIHKNEDNMVEKIPDGKLGFEEYCSKGLAMSGFDVSEAALYTDFIKFITIYDVEVGVDTRDHKDKSDDNYVLSDPYILDGIEYGWDVNSIELAYRVFNVQKSRYNKTNIITAVSEDYTTLPPYFVYNTIYVDGKTWNCVDKKGNDAEDLKSVSTKAAFGWNVLFQDTYADLLLETVKDLNDPKKGWYSGKYEKSGKPNTTITATTNGMILECLNYKVHGKMVKL